jgi:hypothetical protein
MHRQTWIVVWQVAGYDSSSRTLLRSFLGFTCKHATDSLELVLAMGQLLAGLPLTEGDSCVAEWHVIVRGSRVPHIRQHACACACEQAALTCAIRNPAV